MPSIGPMELAIVLIIALVIFGPKRLPDLGRSLGNGMREFKDSVTGSDKDEDEDRSEAVLVAGDDPAEQVDDTDTGTAADAETVESEDREPARTAG